MFMDRIDMADDNAEHLYRYCANVDDGVDNHFLQDTFKEAIDKSWNVYKSSKKDK